MLPEQVFAAVHSKKSIPKLFHKTENHSEKPGAYGPNILIYHDNDI